nr:TonB-dependent receptor [Gemmatimonadota bacterium]NIR78871.1 TonB-dependent receptor [Gemmatimonadota bacterium]NIT87516.1 TonB-dependent receptor [Gemmatimonadota bacterium]NIU31384.1 TonB-dependent receptor [Gemmatimonadota bacterium]NIU36059.1 TonB-dependent receptor plug domain-containing protein [Gemmatimonadota bacterium]
MRRFPFVPNLSLLFVIVFVAGGLAAQEADSAGALPDTSEVVDLPPLVVTGTGVPVSPDDLGFALSVVTAGELRSEPRLHAADILRDLPGSFVDESVGPGGPTIVRLRGGEEVFTQILMDGVRVNENGGFFDFQGLALSHVERVEVARGPQSALYGSSAVSGVVNFITPRGRPGPTRWEFRGEGGGAIENGGSLRGNVTASGGTESFRYSAGLGAAYDRGIFDVAHDTRSTDASLRLDALPSDDWSLNGTFRFVTYDSNLPVRDAGATRVPLDPNQENDRQRWIGSVEARYAPTSRWTHTLRGTLYKEDFFFADRVDEFTAPDGIFVANFNLDFDSDLLRPGVEYQGRVELGEYLSTARTAFTYG